MVGKDNSILVKSTLKTKYFIYYCNALTLCYSPKADKVAIYMELSIADIERIDKTPMNFVVGKERSGTTLLQVLLNSHPNIVAPPESRFIILLHTRYGSIKQWTEKNITDFCNDLYKEILFRNLWSIRKEDLISWLLPAKEKLNYPLLCKLVFYSIALPGKDILLLFDKNPIYYYFLPQLEALFPEAKFIHIVRDYRANIVSHRKVFKVKQPADIAHRWIKVNELIENRKKNLGQSYFTLKYETLVTEPENSMKNVCKFLDIPYRENMGKDHITFMYDTFKRNEKQRFREMHNSLFQPINSGHIDEWKQMLLPRDVTEAEAIAGNYAKSRYGYEPTTKPGRIFFLRVWGIELKYLVVKNIYRIAFRRLWLYYYIKNNIWNSF